jgi:hypothetical protein
VGGRKGRRVYSKHEQIEIRDELCVARRERSNESSVQEMSVFGQALGGEFEREGVMKE